MLRPSVIAASEVVTLVGFVLDLALPGIACVGGAFVMVLVGLGVAIGAVCDCA